ncbi:hypothetical protein B0H10DRAFT_1652534, partial [Mycena sp. CBHHK59/15]
EWRAERDGTRKGAVQKKATTVNWFHPFLWDQIDKQMQRTGWSPSAMVKYLQRDRPVVFKGLQKGTILRWWVKGKNEWTDATLQKISAGKAITGSCWTSILSPYPEITQNIKETLKGLCESGAVVNVSITRGLMIAEISESQPHLLEKFKVSE